jgi:OmpA-OmpF porin, OOP family
LLTANPSLKVRVETYAYNGGTASDDLELSRKEAGAVVRWLVTHGIDHSRLQAMGLGAAAPLEQEEQGGPAAARHEIDLVKMP